MNKSIIKNIKPLGFTWETHEKKILTMYLKSSGNLPPANNEL